MNPLTIRERRKAEFTARLKCNLFPFSNASDVVGRIALPTAIIIPPTTPDIRDEIPNSATESKLWAPRSK